jgi:predicted AAA+ superfamily ATPase
LRYAGLRVIYGPYGAGKSTFLRQVSKALKAVNGVYVVYMNFA